MKIGKILYQLKRRLLIPAQILPRQQYMKFLCWIYKDYVEFDKQRLPRFIASDVYFDRTSKIYVGGLVTITSQVNILTHDYSVDYGLIAIKQNDLSHEYKVKNSVWIGAESFIGQKAIILPGVHIGKNCIIGCGSVVTKDIPDNSVAAGNPAKVLAETRAWIEKKYSDDKDYIE